MYFRNFPLLQYPIEDGQVETVQDILIRVGFTDKVKDEAETFIKYDVPEGYTPEKIAEDVYGDQQYFWVVLLFNNFLDGQYSPPLRSRSFDDYVNKKYPSKTLFLTPEGITQEFFKYPFGATAKSNTFQKGDTITVRLGINNYRDTGSGGVHGVVRRFIPELSALELDEVKGEFKVGETIVRGYGTEIKARVQKIIDSRYALHHFEKDGKKLNPLGTPPDDDNKQVPLGQTGDGFSSVPVGVTQTVLENYMVDNSTNNVITNEEYEFTENETNRSIRLLSPELLENVVREFREILEN